MEIEIKLTGAGFLQGNRWVEDGSLQIQLPTRSLTESGAKTPASTGLRVDASGGGSSPTELNSDWLFLLACGMTEDLSADDAFDHGAIHYDHRWPSPIECATVFHRRPLQWMRDYRRIAVEFSNLTMARAYYCGTSTHALYVLDDAIDDKDLVGKRLVALTPPHSLGYMCVVSHGPSTDRSRADLKRFLERLTREKRAPTDVASVQLLLDAFRKACKADARYRMYSHEGRGAILATKPRLTIGEGGYLWGVYAQVEEEYWDAEH
jgi:hypothetical protein